MQPDHEGNRREVISSLTLLWTYISEKEKKEPTPQKISLNAEMLNEP